MAKYKCAQALCKYTASKGGDCCGQPLELVSKPKKSAAGLRREKEKSGCTDCTCC